jgi:hypothetical protein
MDNGKCAKCGKTTYPSKSGRVYDNCYDCNQEAKATEQSKLPVRSAQEEAGDIYAVFRIFVRLVQADEPKIDAALGLQTALGLTQQFWSNARTPGGLNR